MSVSSEKLQRWSLAGVNVGPSSARKLSRTLLYERVADAFLGSNIAVLKRLAAVQSGQSVASLVLSPQFASCIRSQYVQAGIPVSFENKGAGAALAPSDD